MLKYSRSLHLGVNFYLLNVGATHNNSQYKHLAYSFSSISWPTQVSFFAVLCPQLIFNLSKYLVCIDPYAGFTALVWIKLLKNCLRNLLSVSYAYSSQMEHNFKLLQISWKISYRFLQNFSCTLNWKKMFSGSLRKPFTANACFLLNFQTRKRKMGYKA